MPFRLAGTGVLLFVSIACSQPERVADGVPPVTVPGASVTLLGSTDDPAAELIRVTSAVRLSDGRVVVAHMRPVELRVYNPDGALARVIGREGEGPGEYRGPMEIIRTPEDSLLVFDHGNQRWLRFASEGTGFRSVEVDSTQWLPSVTLRHRTITHQSFRSAESCASALVNAMPLPIRGWRELWSTSAGVFWAHLSGDTVWQAVTASNRAVRRVALPPDRRLFDAGAEWLLLGWSDPSGEERLAVVPLVGERVQEVLPECPVTATAPAVARDRVDEFSTSLRSMLGAGEMYYADQGSYPTTSLALDSLPSLQRPVEAELHLIRGDARGWSVIMLDRKSSLACAFGVGGTLWLEWPEGRAICSD